VLNCTPLQNAKQSAYVSADCQLTWWYNDTVFRMNNQPTRIISHDVHNTHSCVVALQLLHTVISHQNHLLPSAKPLPRTKWWIAFPLLQHPSAIRGRLDLDLRSWHENGNLVRSGLDEVSITAAAWKDTCTWPPPAPESAKLHQQRQGHHVEHDRFQKTLSQAFSAKSL
jgi:hypothetical protein